MSTPDFDSMSPEELMAWMESLARRQGADEGFTTDTVMDVPEIDPSTVQDTGPGYIPYGMDPEVWAEKQRQEEERKAARRAAQAGSPAAAPTPSAPLPAAGGASSADVTPAAASVPETPAAPPAPPAPAAASSSAEPDFDSMSTEELMAWMESLARRQGADEGFTTDTVMDIPEIDPTTVQDTGPGYIPYGMDPEVWAEKQRQEEERKAARRTAQTSSVTPPAAQPPAQPVASTPPVEQPAADSYQSPLWDEPAVSEPAASAAPAEADDPLAWLANLGTGDSSGGFGELDLSALGAPLDTPSAQTDDPMAWLESLSQPQASIPGLDQFSLDFGDAITSDPIPSSPAASEPIAASPAPSAASTDTDPLEWLESLARRQGVDEEELITDASLDIPMPENSSTGSSGYTEYTFETPEETPGVDPLSFLNSFDDDEYDLKYDLDDEEADSDSAWLEALASGQGRSADATDDDADETPDTSKILDDLSRNEVDPAAIETWMGSLLDQGASRTDVSDYIEEDTDGLVEAKLPDWLIEQVGMPPAGATSAELPESLFDAEPSSEALSSLDDLDELIDLDISADEVDLGDLADLGQLEGAEADSAVELPDWLREDLSDADEQPAVAEMPDWLKEDIEEYEAVDFDDIFDTESATSEPQTLAEILDLTENAIITSDELVMDSSDPWVEAFEAERTQGLDDISHIPQWYAEKLNELQQGTPQTTPAPTEAAAQAQPGAAAAPTVILAAANLPDEEELPSGALQSIPNWLQSSLTPPEALETPLSVTAEAVPPAEIEVADVTDEAAPVAAELEESPEASSGEMPVWLRDQILEEEAAELEIPEWLRESGIENLSEVPDWLTESITTEEPIVIPPPTVITPAAQAEPEAPVAPPQPTAPQPAPQPAAQPVVQTAIQQPAATGASPSYVPAAAASINVEEVLAAARTGIREGNAELALQNYEAVVRSNRSIEAVISDLNSLTRDEQFKNNPAVYRVLGDGLMRTGNLQDALNTYRKALNML